MQQSLMMQKTNADMRMGNKLEIIIIQKHHASLYTMSIKAMIVALFRNTSLRALIAPQSVNIFIQAKRFLSLFT